jgi:AcrR family transcriptional regulator
VSSYHHGNLRPALIEAAVELARAQGPDGVVLREVARRTGVSHNAAYRHFADREGLLGEVAVVAMGRLSVAMRLAIDTVRLEDPRERAAEQLRSVGRAYVDFALAESGLFEVAFAGHPQPEPDPAGAADPYALLNQCLDTCVEAGVVSPALRPGADVVCWAAVHGFAVLHLDGPLRDLPPDERSATLEVLLDHVARGLA